MFIPSDITIVKSDIATVTDEERYLRPLEFARKYGWAYKTVLKLTKTKGFPSFKMDDNSNRFIIDVLGIPDWLNIQKKKPKRFR